MEPLKNLWPICSLFLEATSVLVLWLSLFWPVKEHPLQRAGLSFSLFIVASCMYACLVGNIELSFCFVACNEAISILRANKCPLNLDS